MEERRSIRERGSDRKEVASAACWAAAIVLFFLFIFLFVPSCSPKIIERTVTETVYRDRFIHDTATVTIPVDVEKIVTRDTASHIENNYAKTDAFVIDGFLHHSLESKPQIIKVPVTVHVTDTLYKESEVITEIKEVHKPLNWWQRFRIKAFWFLSGAVLLLLVWTFRKYIFKLI